MLSLFMTHLQGYKKEALKSPILIVLEVICELLLPLVMAQIVDTAIPAGDVALIFKLGALVHVLLPDSGGNAAGNIFKFADTGIRETLRKMEVFGGVRSRYQCTIAGGAKMFEMSAGIGNIGERNVQMVLKVLAEEHIRVKAKDVGANYARTMLLNVETGGVKVRTSNRQEIILLR